MQPLIAIFLFFKQILAGKGTIGLFQTNKRNPTVPKVALSWYSFLCYFSGRLFIKYPYFRVKILGIQLVNKPEEQAGSIIWTL